MTNGIEATHILEVKTASSEACAIHEKLVP